MRELLKKLMELRDNARLSGVSRRPDGSVSEAYLLGFLQGKHAGVEEAIKVVTTWLDDEDERKRAI